MLLERLLCCGPNSYSKRRNKSSFSIYLFSSAYLTSSTECSRTKCRDSAISTLIELRERRE
ncbi:hypothetical protein LguiB_028291 [Lonicera macranthoides]